MRSCRSATWPRSSYGARHRTDRERSVPRPCTAAGTRHSFNQAKGTVMSSHSIVHPRRRAGLTMGAAIAAGTFVLGVFTAIPVAAQDQPAAAPKTPQVKEDMMQKSEKDVGYGSD